MSVLPWHAPVLAQLAQALTDNRLANAIALTAPPGWGLTELLDRSTKLLLGIEDPRPARELAHSDLRWVEPDGAAIKVEQARAVGEFAVQTAQLGPRKVVAIDAAHTMNVNTANALLKTLEEPPANTHLLLATEYWTRLLPTVRSRLQRRAVAPDEALARAWLEAQGHEAGTTELALLGNAPLQLAAALAEPATSFPAWLTRLDAGPAALETAVKEAQAAGAVNWLAQWYRFVLQTLRTEPSSQHRPLFEFADRLLDARRQLETSNAANEKALLEYLILGWQRLPGADTASRGR